MCFVKLFRERIKSCFLFTISLFHNVILLSACASNHYKISRYHVSEWSGKRWQCCKAVSRSAVGCEPATAWVPSSISSFEETFAEDNVLSLSKYHIRIVIIWVNINTHGLVKWTFFLIWIIFGGGKAYWFITLCVVCFQAYK